MTSKNAISLMSLDFKSDISDMRKTSKLYRELLIFNHLCPIKIFYCLYKYLNNNTFITIFKSIGVR